MLSQLRHSTATNSLSYEIENYSPFVIFQEKKDENSQTKKKMQKLRAQMANLSLKKKVLKHRT